MPLIDQTSLLKHLRDPAYVAMINAPSSEECHFLNALERQHHRCSEAMALEAYSSLVWLFEAYPTVVSVRPEWSPSIDEDDLLLVLFSLHLETREKGGRIRGTYRYEEYPESIAKEGADTFDLAIELGENVSSSGLWNDMSSRFQLFNRKMPYTSAAEIEADMQHDLGPFLTEVQDFILRRTVQPPKGKATTEAKKRPRI